MRSAGIFERTVASIWVALVMMTLVSAPKSHACFADIPLEEVVASKPLVVVGEIYEVKEGPVYIFKKSQDTALIRVERVLKGNAKPGDVLKLRMPSKRGNRRKSSDLYYHEGQRGVWILDFSDKFYRAEYPKQFQAIEEEGAVKAIIEGRKVRE